MTFGKADSVKRYEVRINNSRFTFKPNEWEQAYALHDLFDFVGSDTTFTVVRHK